MSGKTLDDPIYLTDTDDHNATEQLAEWYLDGVDNGRISGAFCELADGATSKNIFIFLTELTLWLLTNGSEGNLFMLDTTDNPLVSALGTALTHFGYKLKLELINSDELIINHCIMIIPLETPTHFLPHNIGDHKIIPGPDQTAGLPLKEYCGSFINYDGTLRFRYSFDYTRNPFEK
jgi:hypothetical protein